MSPPRTNPKRHSRLARRVSKSSLGFHRNSQEAPKPAQSEETSDKSVYRKFQESGFIGCASVEEDLSTTYLQVLSEQLNTKYDHR
jgi:hypothetical protein